MTRTPSTPEPGVEAEAAPTARRQLTRAKLLAAALQIFTELGFQAASVEAVCARAGFSRGAFYSNFASKDELFVTLLQQEFHDRAQQVRDSVAQLSPRLRERPTPLSATEAIEYIAAFFEPHGNATAWYMLETELSLLSMREPQNAPNLSQLTRDFHASISDAVELAVHAAGRSFALPTERVIIIISSVFERALRISAVEGPDAPEGLSTLAAQISELLFVLTLPQNNPPETE